MGEPPRRMRRTSSGLWVPGAAEPPADEGPYSGGGPGGGGATPAAAEDAESEDSLAAKLERAQTEAREHRESWLRILADFENVRRRSAIELAEARDRGRSEVLLPLLTVLDDVDRALAAGDLDQATRPRNGEEGDPILQGLRLIRARLWELLRSQGVEEIPASDQPFDPHVHEAVMQISAPEVPAGHVAQVFSSGYRLGERILRPARVAVAKDSAQGSGSNPA